ncbi:MAG: threonine synthase [Chloroflexi bacterium]|nr:threonine synthase [Chloroflexota bacterium]
MERGDVGTSPPTPSPTRRGADAGGAGDDPLGTGAIISAPEGNTNLYPAGTSLARWVGVDDLWLKHEGENPTGSFKDRGMTVGVTQARRLGAKIVACASTGNTASSMAAYAARGDFRAFVFLPRGEIAQGKLSQALAYGARTVEVRGDFDTAMHLVAELAHDHAVYVLNSINPFRLEGQKTIVYELIQQLGWSPPDWIVLPGGNLGNTSAFGKALLELRDLGLIARLPRLAVIQAAGASPFAAAFRTGFREFQPQKAQTIATAIKIGHPVNYAKARRVVEALDGVVEQVTDQEIMDAKALVDRAGIGCEPASAASVAGARKLAVARTIRPGDRVVALLTGHLLKDPEASLNYHYGRLPDISPVAPNRPIAIEPTLDQVRRLLREDTR